MQYCPVGLNLGDVTNFMLKPSRSVALVCAAAALSATRGIPAGIEYLAGTRLDPQSLLRKTATD